jgi:hypothetical protein
MAAGQIKVFLSWSGSRSKAVATALYEWLPHLFNMVDPWMSDESISKGARWNRAVSDALDQSRFGVVCIADRNWTSPWLLFEAGAISKAVNSEPHVFTYLLDCSPSDVEAPLGQFQHTRTDRPDTLRLVQSLNVALGEASRPKEQVAAGFELLWPKLHEMLEAIPVATEPPAPPRSLESMLEEILELARAQARSTGAVDAALSLVRGQFVRSVLQAPGEHTMRGFLDVLPPDEQIELLEGERAKRLAAGDPSWIAHLDYQLTIARARKAYEATIAVTGPAWEIPQVSSPPANPLNVETPGWPPPPGGKGSESAAGNESPSA